ncbi:MAG: RNA methyltransferase [Clostridia bacterium]|nr:RNA methyltransferase [Clostridia bacterium]
MKTITSKQNEKIKYLKKQKEHNRFLLFLDNPKLVGEAINSGLKPIDIFVDETNKNLIETYKNFDITLTTNLIVNQLSDVKTPQGIVAVFELAPKSLKSPRGNFLVLDNIQDAGNVGTILRSALGANFLDVFLLDCASVTSSKTIRSSMGAIFKLNVYETTKQEFLTFSKTLKTAIYFADMQGENVFETNFENPCGIVLGNEGNGVSEELKNICQKAISIPMQNGLESLNVAIAGSVAIFEVGWKQSTNLKKSK